MKRRAVRMAELGAQRKQYALLGVANVLSHLDPAQFGLIRGVFLFGSVARGTAARESDIDIFFDVAAPKKRHAKLRADFQKAFDDFALSQAGLRFKMAGVANAFAPIVGRLEEWSDLQRAIALSGIQLYGPARISVARGEPWLIYYWDRVPSGKRGAFLNALHGYRVGKKKYAGLLQRARGFKTGKSGVAFPKARSPEFEELLRKYNVEYSILEFYR
jgi:hypothetical protein